MLIFLVLVLGPLVCMASGLVLYSGNIHVPIGCDILHYYPLLGGCYVYGSTINLLQPAQGDKVTISPVVRVCI